MPTTRIKELAWQPRVRDVMSYLYYGYGSSAPSDGEGAGTAVKGSLFVDIVSGIVYRNAGSRTSPVWLPLGAAENTKFLDDEDLRFGSGSSAADESVSDRTIYYDSTEQRLVFAATREAATSPAYAYGLVMDGDGLFAGTGAGVKQFGLYLTGGRDSAYVMGGDSHDMQLKIDYSNEAVNTPAGSYARGMSVQMNNKSAGEITSLQGGFLGVRQRSTAAAATLLGLQIDTKIDSGKAAATTAVEGLRVEMDLCANSPASSYGVVVRNRTDGVYTVPTAAFKAYNDGTSSCKGFTYGLDLYGADARTALAEIRLASADSDGLGGLILSGTGTDDTTIAADLAARGISAAHGSLYLSIVKGAGSAWSNKNGTWTVVV